MANDSASLDIGEDVCFCHIVLYRYFDNNAYAILPRFYDNIVPMA